MSNAVKAVVTHWFFRWLKSSGICLAHIYSQIVSNNFKGEIVPFGLHSTGCKDCDVIMGMKGKIHVCRAGKLNWHEVISAGEVCMVASLMTVWFKNNHKLKFFCLIVWSTVAASNGMECSLLLHPIPTPMTTHWCSACCAQAHTQSRDQLPISKFEFFA